MRGPIGIVWWSPPDFVMPGHIVTRALPRLDSTILDGYLPEVRAQLLEAYGSSTTADAMTRFGRDEATF